MVTSNRFLRLDFIANLLVICLCCYTLITISNHFSAHKPTTFNSPLHGKPFPTKLLNWSKAEKTVVLALQAGCHYCVDSAPFYRKLATVTAEHGIQLTAVSPHSPLTAGAFLNRIGLSGVEVRQVQLPAIEVNGTPTLFIVDKSGKIFDVWVGELTQHEEDDVLKTLLK